MKTRYTYSSGNEIMVAFFMEREKKKCVPSKSSSLWPTQASGCGCGSFFAALLSLCCSYGGKQAVWRNQPSLSSYFDLFCVVEKQRTSLSRHTLSLVVVALLRGAGRDALSGHSARHAHEGMCMCVREFAAACARACAHVPRVLCCFPPSPASLVSVSPPLTMFPLGKGEHPKSTWGKYFVPQVVIWQREGDAQQRE